jgi:ATP-binding cassette subfamily B protein
MIARIARSRLVRVLSLMERRFWLYILGIVIWGLVLAFCFNMVMAFVFKDVLNASIDGDSSLLVRGIILALVTFVVGTPAACLGRYALTLTACRTLTSIRTRLFSRITRLPMARLEARHSGDLVSRSTNDVQTVWEMLLGHMSGLAQAIGQGSIGIAAIFILEWRLGFVALAVGLASFGVSTRFAGPLRERSDTMQSSIATMTERLSDLLTGVSVTRMFRLEEPIHGEFRVASNEAAQRTITHARTRSGFEAVQQLLEWFQTFGSMAIGLYLFSRGHLLVGAVWAVVQLQVNASYLFNYLGQFITNIQRGLAGGQRILDVLDLPAEAVPEGAMTPQSVRTREASIALRDVSFSYSGDRRDLVLRDVSLTAKQGSIVALVGPSGGGKSTLLKLLLGFYRPTAGELRIGGVPVTDKSLDELRRMTAYVPQDGYLFSGTVAENIEYGRPGATRAEIVEAARAANAHAFILEQPDEYETQVGERGARLSGGQRQRIAIARALLRNAPILLLDEATSALDSESEQLVQDALDVLMRGRTTIAVAHRLSTIEHADRIVVLDEGRIVEAGDHEELLAAGSLYHRLHELQFAI